VRFSLGGGGTDRPACDEQHGGFVVSAAIDKDVQVTANKRFYPDIRLADSKVEVARTVGESARGLRPLRFRFDMDSARIVANLHHS
jgi:galactokinase/mevalonate kinase-like predicted kinase